MGLYNFKKRFVPFIRDGTKTHTIRAGGKVRDRVGNTMHLYTGLRQRGAQLLLRAPCVMVETISIDHSDDLSIVIHIDGVEIGKDECEALAKRDGFSDFDEMMHFWDGRIPFDGHIYHWKFTQ